MTEARIHIVGASGSGTTTLGAALAHASGGAHLDTDDYFWLATDPPFTTKRPVEERLALLTADLDRHAAWVLTGSLIDWGNVLIPRFDLVVFLYVPQEIRIERLMQRERLRYGSQIEPGGRMHAAHTEFVSWAKGYDDPAFEGRSLKGHRAWLQHLPCPVLEITGTPSIDRHSIHSSRGPSAWSRRAPSGRGC